LAAAAVVIGGALAVSGCGSSHPGQTTQTAPGGGTLTTGVADNYFSYMAQAARASNRYFSIFAAAPGKRRCSIPDGAPSTKPLRGTCQTTVRSRPTQEPSVRVNFTETWLRLECTPDLDVACAHPHAHHTWQVIEGETIEKLGTKPHVYSTRSSGATPPQEDK
jgi:hypothetical protein